MMCEKVKSGVEGDCTGSQDGNHANPSQARNLAERLDAAEREAQDSGNSDKHGRARRVDRDGIQSNRDAQHGGARRENPHEHKGGGEHLLADAAKDQIAGIVDAVDGPVAQLEAAHHVA
jgi:hypothetical protein